MTGETRQYLENGMERMLRSRQEISEMKERLGIIPYVDKTLASNRMRYLQLVCALMKRDLVTLIEVDEVREHAGVFHGGKAGESYTTADCRCEGQQPALLASTWGRFGDPTSLETEREHCAIETEKGEAVAARRTLWGKTK